MKIDFKKYFTEKKFLPIGKFEPIVYLVTDPPNFQCVEEGTFLYKDYKTILLSNLIDSKLFSNEEEVLEKTRISPCIPFACKQPHIPSFSNRKTTEEDINSFKEFILKDIQVSKPRVIVTFGAFANSIFGAGDGDKYFNGIKVINCPSITYLRILSSEGKNVKLISKFKLLKNYLDGNDNSKILENLSYQTLDVYSLNDIKKMENLFKDDEKLVLDYETSGLDPYHSGFHLGGFGLCNLQRTKTVYVYFYDFWRRKKYSDDIPNEYLNRINEFLGKKELIVFNMSFECAVTLSKVVGINLNLTKVTDVLMLLRCLGDSSGLKDACVRRLGIPKWNDDVEKWVEHIDLLIKAQKQTRINNKAEIEWLLQTRKEPRSYFTELLSFYKEKFWEEVLKDLKRVHKSFLGKDTPTPKIKIKDDESENILRDFLDKNSIKLRSKKESKTLIPEIKSLSNFKELKFATGRTTFLTARDNKIIDELIKLKDLCEKICDGNKTLFEDLSVKLRDYFLEKAEDPNSEISYSEIPLAIIGKYCALDCQYTAALYLEVMNELRELGLEHAAKHYNDHGYLGVVLARNGIAWDDNLASELKEKYESRALDCLRKFILLPRMTKILKLTDQDLVKIQATLDIEILKEYFNPGSTYKYKDESESKNIGWRLSKLLLTDRVKLAFVIFEVHEIAFNTEDTDYLNTAYPILYPLYLKISKAEDQDKLQIVEETLKNSEEFYKKILLAAKLKKNSGEDTPEFDLFLKYKDFQFESVGNEQTIRICDVFRTILGMLADKPENWIEEYKGIFYFKVYKKIRKSIDTYLEGTCGRGSVCVIDKDEIKDLAPIRKRRYGNTPLDELEIYLLETNWGVCSAITKRWQASQHTVPASTELMDLRTSRFSDGIKFHFDFSQAEVRVLAALADEQNLLREFEQGLDVHCYSKDTEVFTQKGWVKFEDLDNSDQVMQYNPENKELTFTDCLKIRNKTKSKGIYLDKSNQLITENHRLFVYSVKYKKYKEVIAKDIVTTNGDLRFITAGNYKQESNLSELEQRLLVSIHDDGHLSKNGVNFEFKKERKIERLKWLLDSLNLKYSTHRREIKNSTQIRIFSQEKLEVILNFLGENKIIPWKGLSQDIILDEIKHWDGTVRPDGAIVYDTTDLESRNNLHTLAILSGKKSKVHSYVKKTTYGTCVIHRLHISIKNPYISLITCSKTDTILNESYCVSVPTGWILTKRNGISCISGNSLNAALISGKPLEEVTAEERRNAKAVTFSLLYGKGKMEFAKSFTKGSIEETNKIFDKFFCGRPNVKKFIESMHLQGAMNNWVPSIFGDPIYVDTPEWFFSLDTKDQYKLIKNPYDRTVNIKNTEGRHKIANDEDDRKQRALLSKALRNSQNYCFTGDTLIKLLNGSLVKIKDLVGTTPWLYSYDLENEEIVPSKAKAIWKSGEVILTYKVTLDNNEIIECTPNHKFMLRDGTYKEAQDLIVGQSLMPIYTKERDGYEQVIHPKSKNKIKYEATHRLVTRKLLKEEECKSYHLEKIHTHHVNLNKLDNTPDNLVLLPENVHIWYHSLRSWIYANTEERRLILKETMINKNQNRKELYPEWNNNQIKAVKETIKKRIIETGGVTGLNKEQRSDTHKIIWKNHGEKIKKSLKLGHNKPKAIENHSNASKIRESDPNYIFNRLIPQILAIRQEGLSYDTPNDWDQSVCKVTIISPQARRYSKSILNRMSWNEFKERIDKLVPNNHKISRIEIVKYENPIEVYDIEVPNYHNFALGAGIFVHNCIQNSSSMIAGLCIYQIQKMIEEYNLTSKIECFTHDSSDIDLQCKDLLKILKFTLECAIDFPKKEFNLPMQIDIEIGVTNNKLVHLSDFEIKDNVLIASYSAKLADIELLKNRCVSNGTMLDYSIDSEKEDVILMEELFTTKRAYTTDLGVPFKKVKGKLRIEVNE